MARGLKGRGSRLGERTVSGHPSRGLSGRGGHGPPGTRGIGLRPHPRAPLSRPFGPEGPPVRWQSRRGLSGSWPGYPRKAHGGSAGQPRSSITHRNEPKSERHAPGKFPPSRVRIVADAFVPLLVAPRKVNRCFPYRHRLVCDWNDLDHDLCVAPATRPHHRSVRETDVHRSVAQGDHDLSLPFDLDCRLRVLSIPAKAELDEPFAYDR